MIVTERERAAETQAEGEAGSMHREPDVGLDPVSPGSRPGPKAGAKSLRHPGILYYSFFFLIFFLILFIYDSHIEREREAETQAEGEAGSMHREPDVGFDPGSPGSRPGPKAGAKPLCHPGIPSKIYFIVLCHSTIRWLRVRSYYTKNG